MTRVGNSTRPARIAPAAAGLLAVLAFEAGAVPEPAPVLSALMAPVTGDLDAMVERRTIRALVPYSRNYYFLDGPVQRGLAFEMLEAFEKFANRRLKTGRIPLRVAIVPVRRDQLIPFLVEGRGDVAVGNLTITPERLEQVDFSRPLLEDVSEIVITGPGVRAPRGIEDLSGMTFHVRRSSSYHASLLALNETLARRGHAPALLEIAAEELEDEDLLEMMNAGLVEALVVDRHKAEFWEKVFPRIVLHREVAVRTGGAIGWALRKGSPKLRRLLDAFVKRHRKGTTIANVLFERYLESNEWVRNPLAEKEMEKFRRTLGLFRRYADRYGFDHLLIAAQAYQESGLDHGARSRDGAVGVMQILPSTAADPNVGIPDVHDLENNVHAGVKYLRFIVDRYFDDPGIDPVNRTLLAFAAYNAGPRRVAGLRRHTRSMGLDPDRWFDNVEVAAARRIGRETVRYVANIYKYFIAYRMAATRLEERDRARAASFK